jgi:hypothetical protein
LMLLADRSTSSPSFAEMKQRSVACGIPRESGYLDVAPLAISARGQASTKREMKEQKDKVIFDTTVLVSLA